MVGHFPCVLGVADRAREDAGEIVERAAGRLRHLLVLTGTVRGDLGEEASTVGRLVGEGAGEETR